MRLKRLLGIAGGFVLGMIIALGVARTVMNELLDLHGHTSRMICLIVLVVVGGTASALVTRATM